MEKPYYQDEYATVELDDTIPCIKVTLKGIPRFSEHYQLVQLKRLELMHQHVKNYPKLHMLTDSSDAGPVLEEDIVYFKNNVLPQMGKAGIRFLAIVMPGNKFTQLIIKEMTNKTGLIKVRYFETVREARLWLRKMTFA
ncbi:hypothetical protein [Chryseosolibacter indicus]|uniref:STAS/SEC14 domain-containing protein n=1 Tax=Chryseosolibacter indicus TaxID=2782351 RepID=A0ABS5VMI3_9BACT|nr:hypothetical protein [Chryseosolibacter indicus]MBT1702658.1 hypothetical protein [Chryseosolibacter indicus]